MAESQPKINQRLMLRFGIALLVVAICLFAWNFFKDWIVDPNANLPIDTTDWVLALKETQNGTQAVVIKPDGTLLENPQPNSSTIDRDPVWQPNGYRVFFTSNRDEKKSAFHVYKWSLANNQVEQGTVGSRTQEKPYFDADQSAGRPTALLISGGIVVEYDPHDRSTHQVLPFVAKGVTTDTQESGGASSQFGPEYEHLGSSFKEAKWAKNRKFIVATMRRDDGETLIIQNMEPTSAEEARPVPIVAGEHIQFEVDPQTGNVVYAVQNFVFTDPEKLMAQYMQDKQSTPFIKDGKFVKPYRHAVILIDPEKPENSGVILASKDDTASFGSPTISPDGGSLILTFGKYEAAQSTAGLLIMPLKVFNPSAPVSPTPLIRGNISSPRFSADGQHLTFIMTGKSGTRDVFTMKTNGDEVKDLTDGKGFNFESASYSPAKSTKAP